MRSFIKLIINILIPLIGVVISNSILNTDIGEMIGVKLGEYKHELLFVISTTVLQSIKSYIEEQLEKNTAKLGVFFAESKYPENLNNESVIFLDRSTSVGKVYCIIKFKGNTKHLENSKIKVQFPKWVDIQNSSTDELEIINSRTCYIDCNQMRARSNNTPENFETSIKIMIISRGYKQSDEKKIDITSELIYRKYKLRRLLFEFNTNCFKLKS